MNQLKEQIAATEKLPAQQRYPKLYELNGISEVINSFENLINSLQKEYKKKPYSSEAFNQKIENAYNELEEILLNNNITLSTFLRVRIVMKKNLSKIPLGRDTSVSHFC